MVPQNQTKLILGTMFNNNFICFFINNSHTAFYTFFFSDFISEFTTNQFYLRIIHNYDIVFTNLKRLIAILNKY